MTEEAGCLKGLLEYSTDLFEAATIDLLLRSFEALLAGIVANPDAELGALPLLHESERRQLLEWSARRSSLAMDGLGRVTSAYIICSRSTARRNPDALAVIGGKEEWSYRRLNETPTGWHGCSPSGCRPGSPGRCRAALAPAVGCAAGHPQGGRGLCSL